MSDRVALFFGILILAIATACAIVQAIRYFQRSQAADEIGHHYSGFHYGMLTIALSLCAGSGIGVLLFAIIKLCYG